MMPTALPLDKLKATHADFNPSRLEVYDALYEGGSKAEAVAPQILVKRKLEKAKPELYAARLERSGYIPHGAVLDFLCAAVFLDEPRFKGTPYFEGLNEDCDGEGLDLSALARQILLETFLHGANPGAYLSIGFDSLVGDYKDGEADTLAARWRLLDAAKVDDWGDDWVRVHTCDLERSSPVDNAVEVDRWIYITAHEVATYERRATDKGESVSGVVVPHSFGRCPVFRVKLPHAGMWVMDRIAPILKALFNRESALTYALDQGCFSIPVLKTDANAKNLICEETHGIKLRPGEDFGFASPNSTVYQPGFDDLARLREELARAVHGLALEAAAKTQSPRQGAFAAAMQKGPLEALLQSFAAPIRDVFETAGRSVAVYRSEPAPTLEGLARFDSSLDNLAEAVGQGGKPGAEDTGRGEPGAPADNAPPDVKG